MSLGVVLSLCQYLGRRDGGVGYDSSRSYKSSWTDILRL